MDRHAKWLRRRIVASVVSQSAVTFAVVSVFAFVLLQWRTGGGFLTSLFASLVIGQLVALVRVLHAMKTNPLDYASMRRHLDIPFTYRVSRFHGRERVHPVAEQLPGFEPIATIRDSAADPEPVFDIYHDPSQLVAASVNRATGFISLISSLENDRVLVTNTQIMPPHERLVISLAEDNSVQSIIDTHRRAITARSDVVELASSAHQVVLDAFTIEYESYATVGAFLTPFLDLEPEKTSRFRLTAKIDEDELTALPTRLGPDFVMSAVRSAPSQRSRKQAAPATSDAPPSTPIVTDSGQTVPQVIAPQMITPDIVTPTMVDAEVVAPNLAEVVAPAAVVVEPVAEFVAPEPVVVEPVAEVVAPAAVVVEPVAEVVAPEPVVVEPVAEVVAPEPVVVEPVAEVHATLPSIEPVVDSPHDSELSSLNVSEATDGAPLDLSAAIASLGSVPAINDIAAPETAFAVEEPIESVAAVAVAAEPVAPAPVIEAPAAVVVDPLVALPATVAGSVDAPVQPAAIADPNQDPSLVKRPLSVPVRVPSSVAAHLLAPPHVVAGSLATYVANERGTQPIDELSPVAAPVSDELSPVAAPVSDVQPMAASTDPIPDYILQAPPESFADAIVSAPDTAAALGEPSEVGWPSEPAFDVDEPTLVPDLSSALGRNEELSPERPRLSEVIRANSAPEPDNSLARRSRRKPR